MNDCIPIKNKRFVVSICGGSGCGKSTLSKMICEQVGHQWSTRIPTDYYLLPNKFLSIDEFFKHPLEYDWELIDRALLENDGQILSTPDYDFVRFQRITLEGGRSYVMRPLVIIDAMLPYPKSNLAVFLDVPDDERRRRIIARDNIWQTQVISNWEQHQLTLDFAKNLDIIYDIIVDATQPIDIISEYVVSNIKQRFLYGFFKETKVTKVR